MIDADHPVGFRADGAEVIVSFVIGFIEQASRCDGLSVDGVGTCDIERNWVEGCEHSDIRDDRQVVIRMTVAERCDIDHETDVEMRTTVENGFRILGDLLVQDVVGLVRGLADRILGTGLRYSGRSRRIFVIDRRFLSVIVIASCTVFRAERAQPTHLRSFTNGFPALCISIFPAREPQPIPMFFRAPRIR